MKIRPDEPCVIMHKGQILKSILFNSISEARNSLRFMYPKIKFKEQAKNTFVCSLYGSKFEIIELNVFPSTNTY